MNYLFFNSVYKFLYTFLVCVVVCPLLETPLPGGLETLGERAYRYYWVSRRFFWTVSMIDLGFKILCFWSFGTSLLCIVGELAGGGSLAVAFGVSDR